MGKEQQVLPRILRYRSAPGYLGMCRAEFDKTVRPFVKEFAIGARGVGFDRYELDEWADRYIAEHAIDKAAGQIPSSLQTGLLTNGARHQQAKSEFEGALKLVSRRR